MPFGSIPVLRWALILSVLACILLTSYTALTNRRSARANNIVGPLTSGKTVGQSFVARYPALSGIDVWLGTYGRGADPSRAPLVMRLRSAPGGPDLAEAVLPPQQRLEENPWYTFSFPPIAASQGKSFYVEFESPNGSDANVLTLYWWRSDPKIPTDPYVGGTAYLDGVPQEADLAFGLRYSPSPLDAWAQMLREASSNFPPMLMLASLLGAAALGAYFGMAVPRLLRDPAGRRKWLKRGSLPFVMGVALLNGFLYMMLIPPWQGWDEHGHFTYAALLDKYGLDDRKVQQLEWWEGGRDRAEVLQLKAIVWTAMLEHDWTHRVGGYPVPGHTNPVMGNDPVFSDFVFELRQPPPYYWLSAGTMGLTRGLGLPTDPYTHPDGALMVMRAVSLFLKLIVVALAWLAGVLLSWGRQAWLRLLLPLTIALLPMHTYIGVSADNDIFAEVFSTALFVALICLLRRPGGRRGVLFAALVLALGGLSAAAKSTAVVAALPLAGLGICVWLGLLATRGVRSWQQRSHPTSGNPRPVILPLAFIALFLLVGAGLAWASIEADSTAAGWQAGGGPRARSTYAQAPDAHSGARVLNLQPGQLSYQWVDLPPAHPAFSMTISLWARQPEIGANPSRVALLVDQRGRLPLTGAETLSSVELSMPLTITRTATWTPFSFTVPVYPADRKVMARFQAGDRPVQIDTLSLTGSVPSTPAGGNPEQLQLSLFNPSFETGTWRLRPALDRILPAEQVDILDVLVNPQAFDKLSIWRRYAYREFRSFWGNFGWVSVPLPERIFGIINGAIAVALAGLALLGLRYIGCWSWREWLGVVALISLVVAVVMGFAKQMAPLSTSGVHADPHGRYLFVLMTPVMWLFIAGVWYAWALLSRLASRVMDHAKLPISISGQAAVPWGAWLWIVALFTFTAYCLISLIGPYYYG